MMFLKVAMQKRNNEKEDDALKDLGNKVQSDEGPEKLYILIFWRIQEFICQVSVIILWL